MDFIQEQNPQMDMSLMCLRNCQMEEALKNNKKQIELYWIP
jgi:hypothetical protein